MNEIRNPSGEVNIEFLTKLQSAMDVNQGLDGEIGESQPNPRAEGIFAAQCILKKRTRKVLTSSFMIEQILKHVLDSLTCFVFRFSGTSRVFGQMERLVGQVSIMAYYQQDRICHLLKYSPYFPRIPRNNTWEPAENILDGRLILAFENRYYLRRNISNVCRNSVIFYCRCNFIGIWSVHFLIFSLF